MDGAKLIIWWVLAVSSAVHAQDRVTANVVEQRSSVPAEYAGDWVCQSAVAGYNLPMPVVPGQAPSTQRMTTPPSTVVIKFTLAGDGTYQAANARGHYSFHAADKSISWVDGLHREQFSNTKVSRRSDGAPSLSFTASQRYYGCYLSKGLGRPGPKSSDRASTETRATPAGGRARYTKEEFLALGRQGGKAYEKGDYITARRIFEDLVDADPNDASAQAALGALMVQVRETEPALAHLTRAIELDPREISAYANRGEAYLRLGRRVEGEADLRKAISFDPAGKNPIANRARALLRGTIRP
jgi:tetratricopeptide (TPR) repeat protein